MLIALPRWIATEMRWSKKSNDRESPVFLVISCISSKEDIKSLLSLLKMKNVDNFLISTLFYLLIAYDWCICIQKTKCTHQFIWTHKLYRIDIPSIEFMLNVQVTYENIENIIHHFETWRACNFIRNLKRNFPWSITFFFAVILRCVGWLVGRSYLFPVLICFQYTKT